MQFAQRQRLFGERWRPILAAIPVGLLLGFAGPFGSYPRFPTATRYAFWFGLTMAGVGAAMAANAMLPTAKLRAGAMRIAAVALASAVPMTFVVAWTMSLVQPGRFYAPQQLLALFWGVAAVQLLIVYATALASPKGADEEASAPALPLPAVAEQGDTPRFPAVLLNKLPPAIGHDIVALETEDHYLRVHAAGGSALILMRMADAVAMLDPQLGAQVHRRWWVAERAVVGMRTEGQRLFLRLTNDSEVPVGRTFAAAARTRFVAGR